MVVLHHGLGYNVSRNEQSFQFPGMFDNSWYFDPTFTFMGFLYCHVAVRPPNMARGRQKQDCGYPPSYS